MSSNAKFRWFLLAPIVIFFGLGELSYAAEPELFVQRGHGDSVRSITYSPDNRLIASRDIGDIVVWENATGDEIQRISNVNLIGPVLFSPKGDFIFGIKGKKEIFKIEVTSGVQIHGYKVPTEITDFAISPDGEMLAVGDKESVELFNIETGELLKSLNPNGFSGKINFSSDSRHIVMGVHSKTSRRLTNSEIERFMRGEKFEASNKEIQIWDSLTHKNVMTKKTSLDGIGMVRFCLNDEFIIFSGKEKAFEGTFKSSKTADISLWNISSEREVFKLKTQFSGDLDDLDYSSDISPDGTLLLLGHNKTH